MEVVRVVVVEVVFVVVKLGSKIHTHFRLSMAKLIGAKSVFYFMGMCVNITKFCQKSSIFS